MNALELLHTWPVDNASAGWITAKGHSKTVGDQLHSYELASVTKPLFTLAILVAVEEGTLHLDQAAGPQGSTLRHLLSHSSGLAPQADAENPQMTLGPPGQRRIYSNFGFDCLGEELAKASGISASEYFHEAVVEPLGLANTRIHGSPAKDATSTLEDLLKIAKELLNPSLISPQTLKTAITTHLPALEGVLPGYGKQTPNPWGLGFEIKSTKSPHWTALENSPRTFGHFGQSGTFLWVDPLAEIACVALTDRPFGNWANEYWPSLSKEVLQRSSQ